MRAASARARMRLLQPDAHSRSAQRAVRKEIWPESDKEMDKRTNTWRNGACKLLFSPLPVASAPHSILPLVRAVRAFRLPFLSDESGDRLERGAARRIDSEAESYAR